MKIVVFSDGTGNSSAKLFRTNVWRLYEALDLCDNTKQVAFYDNGVGTASFVPLALLGGAFGFGLKRNVRDIYTFICRNVAKPGEHQIYTFGFSRGAFTIRVLLGLIERQGLVPYHGDDRELTRMATWAYREYRREALPGGLIVKTFRWIRDTALRFFDWIRDTAPRFFAARRGATPYTSKHNRYTSKDNRRDVRVTFVGLWDTVAAYGFPIVEMTRGWDRWVWPLNLPTRELVQQADKACHALALDDERQTFHPLLWNEKDEKSVWLGAPEGTHEIGKIANERVSQVWFSGMHSNVGGGYPDDGMAYEPLCWIAEQAADNSKGHGLLLKPNTLDEWKKRCSPSAPMSDSRSGVGAYYRYLPRLVHALANDKVHKVDIARPKIHASVLRRIKARIDGYAPIVLPPNYLVTDGKDIFDLPATELGSECVVETSTQAEERYARQEQVWDAVWYRRIAYFMTVGVTLATLVLVLLPDSINSRILPWAFPTVSGTIALLSGMLPAIAAPVLEHFETYPSQLVAGGLAALLLMRFSSFVERRNSDSMRKIWAQQPPPGPSVFLRFARRVRKSDWYIKALDSLRYAIAPNVFGVLMLLLIVFAAAVITIRLSFDAPMILGQVCKNALNPATVTSERLELREFDLTSPCHPMGARLRAGETYVISVEPRELHWRDLTVPVTTLKGFKPEGFSRKDWVFWLTIPIRRHKVMDWYVPVARVGSYGDHYFPITNWTTEITPQTDGQLFLYVNDALSIYPFTYAFYLNNNTCTDEAEAGTGAFDTCRKQPREKWYVARKPTE
jgi:uncharacterized protein (DUF2235 family)